MRILYLTPAGERGGAETVLFNIIHNLDRNRFNPSVISFQEGSFIDELREKANVEVEIVPAGRYRNLIEALKVIRKIQSIIRKKQIHLVHSNGTGAHLFGGIAARLCKTPNLFHIHDSLHWSRSLQGALNKLALMVPSTYAIAVSNFAERRLKQNILALTNIKVIHNALSDESFIPATIASDVKHDFGWSDDVPLIVWCGRLQRWKGTHIFLKAAAIANQQFPEARFLIVGGSLFGIESEYEKELRSLVKELNIETSVHFTGHVKDVQRYLSAADLFVHTSIDPEPFGMVLVEAMALGLPVIASNAGGPVEIVEPNQTGLLVEPDNPQALAAAMIQLLKDENQRIAMGKAGRERAEKHFSISQMMASLESLYDEVLGQTVNRTNHVASIVEG